MQTLLFYEPGHFHAALLLNSANPRLDRAIHVYATPGDDLDRFVALITDFNTRSHQPTDWDLHLHTEADFAAHPDRLAQLIAEREGELVVIAGKNEPKLAAIDRLHAAGFKVLVDKPWLIEASALPHLDRVTSGPPLVADLMTDRHDVVNRLCLAILSTPEVFGDFLTGTGPRPPDLEFSSVHHLCKVVDGRPLIRPAWYYDVGIQGDGMVDIHSHLVDQAQWFIDSLRPSPTGHDGWRDDEIQLLGANRSSTAVAQADFAESTGLADFPPSLADRVSTSGAASTSGPVLDLACNGRLTYLLRGVLVGQQTTWRVRSDDGSGDKHTFVARGSAATVVVASSTSPPVLAVHLFTSNTAGPALASFVERCQHEFPGLATEASSEGYRLILPDSLSTPHESVFANVLEDFVRRADHGPWSKAEASTIRLRYRLLADAQRLADEGSDLPELSNGEGTE